MKSIYKNIRYTYNYIYIYIPRASGCGALRIRLLAEEGRPTDVLVVRLDNEFDNDLVVLEFLKVALDKVLDLDILEEEEEEEEEVHDASVGFIVCERCTLELELDLMSLSPPPTSGVFSEVSTASGATDISSSSQSSCT